MAEIAHEPGPSTRPTIAKRLEVVLASTLTIASILWALGVPSMLRLDVYDSQFYGGMFAVALPLAFIVFPVRRGAARAGVPWYDWLAAVVGFLAAGYLVWNYQRLVDLVMLRPVDAMIAGTIMIVLALEALRRATGLTLVIVSVVFVAYALVGQVLPGRFAAQPIDATQLVPYLALDINAILGSPLAVATTIVIVFVFFGHVLNRAGGSAFFTDLALLGLGRMRGGPAKVAVVGSALMGSISGSAVANVVATGVVTIPLIKRAGYPPHKAGAIEAVASTGGQLMPPVMGAAAFLMAEFLSVSYATVIAAALIPSVLYYLALFIQADLDAGRRGLGGVGADELPEVAPVLRGLYFALPFAALLVAMLTFNQSPQIAALIAIVATAGPALALGYRGARPTLRVLAGAVHTAGVASLEIILVCVAAGVVIGVLSVTGLSFNLTFALVQAGEGSLLLLLLLTAGVSIVLGMGLPTVGVYVLLAALVAPALVSSGVNPIAAHLFVIYFGMMSMITPPVAIAAFAASSIAGGDPMRTGWASMQFGWIAYVVPVLFVFSPTLVMIGAPLEIAIAFVTAAMGVWLVSIAIVGFFTRTLSAAHRLAFAGAGLLALIPAGAFEGAVVTDFVGVAIGAGLILWEVRARRRLRSAGL
jgi:TRAP transporter 4TM/12TM fusion protein